MNHLEKAIPEHLYNFPAGFYCGLFLPEKVMKKLAVAHAKHTLEVRKILNTYKDSLMVSHWTLANEMDGEKIKRQVTIRYAVETDTASDVERRINLFKSPQPKKETIVYLATTHEEAKEIAELVLEQEDK